MKKILLVLLMATLGMTVSGCGTANQSAGEETKPAETVAANTADDGYLPVDYPIVKTTAVAGDYVLAPSRTSVDEAFTKGLDNTTVIYYTAKMVTPGDAASVVQDLPGTSGKIPNSLIIPLKKGATAEKGDIILTWWQSGSGLMRAFVTEGGATPKVRYLDSFATGEETLLADSFIKLTGGLEPGVSVAYKNADSGRFEHAILANVAGDKAIILGFAGSLEVVDKSSLTVIPLSLDIKVGDTVLAPIISSYDTVTVKEIKADIGQITGEYKWVDEVKNEPFMFGDIIKELK